MLNLLNLISVVATFILIEGMVYFILNFTVGKIAVIKRFQYKDLVFLLIGLILILKFFRFYLPH